MRITFEEQIEKHKAFSKRMKCKKCGGIHYSIHCQIQPTCIFKWYVQCDECGHESNGAITRTVAIERWQVE